MKRNWILYLFLLPAAIYIGIFMYAPMYGLIIAFKNYSPAKGIMGSPWVGLKWFDTFFHTPRVWQILKNTLVLSLYTLIVGFPFPVILALILNDITGTKAKKFCQTITYMPYFISTVVLVGMLSVFFSPNSGFVNTLLEKLGGSGDVFFMGEEKYLSEVISTYVYKIGLEQQRFTYSTAIGLFNNIINFSMIVLVNKLANKLSGTGLW